MKKLSISILLLMSCFLVTIVSTIAWFSAVRSSQTNGGSINLYKNEIVKNVTFHTCDTTYETDEDILPFMLMEVRIIILENMLSIVQSIKL